MISDGLTLRERPGMWIGEPDVSRLFLFLGGFESAMWMVSADYSGGEPPFGGFHDWIAQRCGFSASTSGWPSMLLATEGTEEAERRRLRTPRRALMLLAFALAGLCTTI